MVKYTKDLLEEAAKKSHSIAGVMRALGVNYISGGLHAHVSKQLKKFEVDTTHFLGQGHNKNRVARNKLSPKEIFVLRKTGRRQKHYILKRALVESGLPHECSTCGQPPFWKGKELTLPVDHINGNPLDDRRENLRFLCPNCHTQTETHSTTKRHS